MKRFGFTLAEVLITLTVIGVVAAITLPPLIQNYQKHVLVNQLKKCISSVENGFKLAMVEDGVDNIFDTDLLKSLRRNDVSPNENVYNSFMNEFKKYFHVVASYNSGFDEWEGYKSIGGRDQSGNGDYWHFKIYLKDGSKLLVPCFVFDSDYNRYFPFFIDVNGDKGPNIMGRDYFQIGLMPNGHGNYVYDERYDCVEDNDLGLNCIKKIINDGWKMNY